MEGPASRRSLRLLWLVAVTAILAAAAWPFDQTITDHLVAAQKTIETIFAAPAALGGFLLIIAILVSFPNRKRLVAGFIAPLLLSAFITHAVKLMLGRARPEMGLGAGDFDPFNTWGGYQSFPSGHSTTAITLALLLGLYFPRARWVFYFYAGLVGLERIIRNRHFTSDVLAGYAVGALAVFICLRLLGPAFYERDLPEPRASAPAP